MSTPDVDSPISDPPGGAQGVSGSLYPTKSSTATPAATVERPQSEPLQQEGSNEEQEYWYKASDGSFFMEKRHPFFIFNLVVYACALALFGYMGTWVRCR